MELSAKEYQHLVQEIACETGAKRDGMGKNLIVPRCPFCGKTGDKFGIYIGLPTSRREPFMPHCFSCGKSTRNTECGNAVTSYPIDGTYRERHIDRRHPPARNAEPADMA